jgi:uncharacterized protein (DUF488 family)
MHVRVLTIGHGTRSADELLACLRDAGARTLVDVRRFPSSRRNPQFNASALEPTLDSAGIAYRHAVELGGRLSAEPGEERFACIGVAAFRSYAARMTRPEWQAALDEALAYPEPCFMCAETPWWRCHRRLIAELLAACGHEVVHVLGPARVERHRTWDIAEYRDGRLFLCGNKVGPGPGSERRLAPRVQGPGAGERPADPNR